MMTRRSTNESLARAGKAGAQTSQSGQPDNRQYQQLSERVNRLRAFGIGWVHLKRFLREWVKKVRLHLSNSDSLQMTDLTVSRMGLSSAQNTRVGTRREKRMAGAFGGVVLPWTGQPPES